MSTTTIERGFEDAIEAVHEAESVATQNTEAGFHEADCLEWYGSAGHRRNHERVSDQRAAGSHDPEGSEELFIGEIVQIPQVTEHRVPICVFSADDRGGYTATIHRSGNSRSAVDRRDATDSVHRQNGARSGGATDTGSSKADGTL